ncbi:hypothetical protein ACP26L_35945 (plasmid) [Paenibacillus sp. S-38]|uniref:hypothetical protein n=1 Tax=Paenibacillus sp. S-38 TaxID=3416710 RepID=UPI003CEE3F67
MKLLDTDRNLLYPLVHNRIIHLQAVLAEWDALPGDAMVNNLERHAVAQAREELPKMQELLQLIMHGEPRVVYEPVTGLEEDDLTQARDMLSSIHEAKYYTDEASNKSLLLSHLTDTRIEERISQVYMELESIETAISELFPETDDDYVRPEEVSHETK